MTAKQQKAAGLSLVKTRLIGGVWEGVLSGVKGAKAPDLAVTHEANPVDGLSVTADKESGDWIVRVPVPPALIADGVQTFVITDVATGATLNSFAVLSGEALAEDIRAELALLREELDLLKKAFRRHCVETA